MESLQLPKDLFWTGKMEPFSPGQQIFSLNNSEDDWTLEKCLKLEKPLEIDIEIDETPIVLDEEITAELLDEIDLAIKCDKDLLSLSIISVDEQWTEDSYGIPNTEQNLTLQLQSDNASSNTFYYHPQQQNGFSFDTIAIEKLYYQQNQQHQQQQQQQQQTSNELTPPHSPPTLHIKDDYIIQNLISQHDQHEQHFQQQQQQQQQQTDDYDFNQLVDAASQAVLPVLSPVTSEYIEYASDVSHASPLSICDDDVARETQIVDEIVRSRAQDLPDNWNDDDISSNSFMDDDSNYEPTSPSFDDNSSIGSPVASTSSSTGNKINSSSEKKRTRPYGRGPEERKSRKKEQNKNAATRYRQKKKEEMKHVLDEESVLAEKHIQLSKTVADFENEVKYLKKLIREFYKNK